jgi:predicted phage-related endonuclease
MREFDVVECKQGEPAWFAARLGLVTGSEAASITARVKKKVDGREQWVDMADRANYKIKLLCERLTGKVDGGEFVTRDMRNGIEREPFARMAYEVRTGASVRESGFLRRRDLPVGCSLDGDVDDYAGIVEIKCLKPKNHIAIIEADEVPAEFAAQITHNLFVSGAAWCDFVAYCPEFPAHLQLFVKRVVSDAKVIERYRGEVVAFLAELAMLERKYKNA